MFEHGPFGWELTSKTDDGSFGHSRFVCLVLQLAWTVQPTSGARILHQREYPGAFTRAPVPAIASYSRAELSGANTHNV